MVLWVNTIAVATGMDLSLHVLSADRFVPPACSADVSYMMQDVR